MCYEYATMESDTEKSITELEVQATALGAELAAVQASLSVARTHALVQRCMGVAEGDNGDGAAALCPNRVLPVSELSRQNARMVGVRPGVLLQPLPLHDALRRKWGLGDGLPSAARCADSAFSRAAKNRSVVPGHLRLYGLLLDGSPWKHDIPFCSLAAEGGVILGREEGVCDLALADESVSRMHARLEISYGGLVVTDLQSTNGVFVNDVQVDSYCPQTPLPDGCVLTLGEVPLYVEYVLPVA